mmetsp:Transcript_53331/g.152893  ORF Transcript_53331/g.152893 Transcript_53331/m.152893 type:complete len:299 (+) Transcript_53331:839-1735(+)
MGWSLPPIKDSSVDFPEPFLPTMPTRLVDRSSRLRSWSVGVSAPLYVKPPRFKVQTGGPGLPCTAPGIRSGVGNCKRSPTSPKLWAKGFPASLSAGFSTTSKSSLAFVSSPLSTVALKESKSPGWYTNFASFVKWITCVQTWFKNSASCDTIIAVPPASPPTHVLRMKATNHATASVSKWFVGSSNNSKLAFCATAHARAKRICQPPLSACTAFSSISSPSKPTACKAFSKSSSEAAVAPLFLSCAYSLAVVFCPMPRKMASCRKCTTRTSCGKPTISLDAILDINVVFPEPLEPTTP